MKAEDKLEIERLGGLAGIGLPGSAIRSRAELTGKDLSAAERTTVATLFDGLTAQPPAPSGADAFRYRVTLHNAEGSRQIEVAEAHLPDSLRDKVQDELA